MSEIIGIGFVGAGGNTKLRHLPGFQEIDGVRLVTVANRSRESSRAVADEWGIERVADDWTQVVADPEVDAVCIGTWPYMHAEITVNALAAGKHVLTEARMAGNLAEAREMLAASQAHPEQVAQIVPSPFTLDLDRTVQRLLETGELGDIREVFIDHAHDMYVDPQAPLTWRQDPAYSGHNMLTMGIYHEVIQRWFPDAFTVDHAGAEIFTRERVHWETGESVAVQLPDCLHVIGQMERGAVFNYHFSGVESGPGRNEIRLVGSRATLHVDVGQGALYLSASDNTSHPLEIPEADKRGWRVEADFIESIRTGKPVELTSFAEGVRYMTFTDEVYRQAIQP